MVSNPSPAFSVADSDPLIAADRFCGMLFSALDMRLACGLPLPPQFTGENLDRHIAAGVRAFLKAHRP